MFEGKTILITGGAGSFGKSFTKYILERHNPKKLIIFSRDEFKQFHMAKEFEGDDRIRFFLGDIRDRDRLERAFNGVDIVIHAAALKHVPILEYNPFEAVKTNITGTQNVINAAIDQKVKKVLVISTDKAALPSNLYGATKLCAEKIAVNGNAYSEETVISAVRYGNVIGSRGSIIETLINAKKDGTKSVSITDEEMTRFWITLEGAGDLVMFALENMRGGEVFIPKIPSMKLVDLFKAVVPDLERKVIGMRSGEKLHEALISSDEARHSVELAKYYVILPEQSDLFQVEPWYAKAPYNGKELPEGFSYLSDTNTEWFEDGDITEIVDKFEKEISS